MQSLALVLTTKLKIDSRKYTKRQKETIKYTIKLALHKKTNTYKYTEHVHYPYDLWIVNNTAEINNRMKTRSESTGLWKIDSAVICDVKPKARDN